MIHGIGQDTAPFSACCGALDCACDFNGAPSGMSLGKGRCHQPPPLFPFSGFPTFDCFETRLLIGRLHSLFSIVPQWAANRWAGHSIVKGGGVQRRPGPGYDSRR